MSQMFSVPCPHCQYVLTIAAKHAGQQLLCPGCQKSFDAPKLRDLKASVPSPVTATKPHSDARPSLLKAGMFSLGLVLLIVGSISGYFLWQYAGELISPADEHQRAIAFGNTFADSSPAEVWQFMESVVANRELPPFEQAEWRTQDELGRFLRNVSYGLFGLAALGLVALIAGLVSMSRDRQGKRKHRRG